MWRRQPGLQIFAQISCRQCSSIKADLYRKCYDILKVPLDSNQETVRAAYIQIVKAVHPDSGHPDASAKKFAEVDNAFRILQERFAKERYGIQESFDIQDRDIEHTAPQHRQYLSFDGVGSGTPFQREKQYEQSKASKAYGKVVEYRIENLSATDAALMKPGSITNKHNIKTKYGFDRVVEDLIQEAMCRGDFNNLQGIGKPLQHTQSQNPYVDFTQHKLNKILIDNGFTPEWIMLKKEIRNDIDDLVNALTNRRGDFKEIPLNEYENNEWSSAVSKYENRAMNINKKIDKYNLIVPILDQQMCQIQLDRIAEKILNSKPICKPKLVTTNNSLQKSNSNENKTLLSSLFWWM